MKNQVTATGKMLSLEDRATVVRRAFEKQMMNGMDDYFPWVVDVYDEYVVVAIDTLEYRQVGYTMTPDGVEFAARDTWTAVEKEWAAKHYTLAVNGGRVEVKSLDDWHLAGYLVTFGNEKTADLTPWHDFFTADTDFDIEWDGNNKASVYFEHGLDPVLKATRLGRGTLKKDDVGIWIDAHLERRAEYEAYVEAVVNAAAAGKMGWSSGTAPHLVEREPVGKAHHIKKWPIPDATITFTPADWRSGVIAFTKSLIHAGSPALDGGADKSAGGTTPEATPETGQPVGDAVKRSTAAVAGLHVHDITEEKKMADQQTPEQNAPELDIKSLGDKMNEVLDFIKNSPDLKRLGYTTDDGGAKDPTHKSMGDYLIAVMRNDTKRLETVYKSVKSFPVGEGEVKALSTDTGSAGGYTVPTEYSAQLLQVASETNPIVSRVRRIPVTTQAGEYPALDNYTAPTAGSGNTAMAGGLTTAKRAEGGAYTETGPQFEMVRYRINDAASGKVLVSKELRADSIIGIEAFLRQVIGIAVGSKLEYYILRGNGVGEPLGILNAPALIGVTPDTNGTFAYADSTEMVGHFKTVGGAPTWVHHPGMINDISAFEVGTGGAVLVQNLGGQIVQTLHGYPRVTSEHAPQATNSGCVLLADLGAYLLFEKGGLYVEFSEHANFDTGQDTWRFGSRMDGQPWMKSYVTLADPQGSYYVSPFVKFDD